MGIMDIILPNKEDKNFNRQMEASEEENALGFAGRSQEWITGKEDAQVNLYIVSNSRKFLKYKPVKINRDGAEQVVYIRDEGDFNFLEPYNDDDPLSFSDPDLQIVINEFGRALSDIYEYVHKYAEDPEEIKSLIADFNMIVRLRNDLLANTRTTGKAVRAAKSQTFSTEASIRRSNEPQQQQKKFGIL
jgi:hypothetical protein